MRSRVEAGGVRLSKQAGELAQRARILGIDPTDILQRAAQAAKDEGRSKVGMFGEPGKHLGYLREVVSRTVFERSR